MFPESAITFLHSFPGQLMRVRRVVRTFRDNNMLSACALCMRVQLTSLLEVRQRRTDCGIGRYEEGMHRANEKAAARAVYSGAIIARAINRLGRAANKSRRGVTSR